MPRRRSKREIRNRYQKRIDQPQNKLQSTYLDKFGYYRFRDTNKLVHRVIAYKIWEANRKQYPLPFGAYVIHHMDGVKTNNRSNNLMLLTIEEHDKLHPHLMAKNDKR